MKSTVNEVLVPIKGYLFVFILFIMKIVHNSTTYRINIGINVEDEYITAAR